MAWQDAKNEPKMEIKSIKKMVSQHFSELGVKGLASPGTK